MADIIRVFDFVVNFQEDKFERKDGNTDVITIVESDNKSTKFKFYFEEELQDGTNVLVKIKHNIGFAKDYVLCIKNKEAELVLTNSITIAGFLKMTISFIGNDNEILTPAQFQNKILVKEAITGETPIPEDDSKLLEGLISQVNLLNDDTKKAVEGIENTFDQINKKLDEKIETINERDNEQDGKITLNKESIKQIQAENERLREDIKSIATIGEASGENIHVEDSSDARCKIEIGGNHKQETRRGKNRINLELLGSGTLNGVTYNYNKENQSITFNGTCTKDNTRFIINDDANIQTIAKKTTFTAQYLSGSVSNYFTARIADNEWKHNLLLSLLTLNSSNNKVSLTETEDMVGVHIDIKANNGTTFNNFTIQVMLTDEVDTEYEMYGASPSPDYPSKIQTVGSVKNILDMSNAKNGASAGIICTTNADGSYKYKGTATSQYVNVWFMGGYATDLPTLFTLEPGTYYINDVSLFEGTTGFTNDSSKKIWTFTRAYNVTGVRAPNAVSGNTYDETKYPIIAKIDHEIPWAPYNYGSVQVSVQNKNYLANITQSSITENGITVTYDGEKFLCKGTITATYFGLIKQTNIYLPIGTYTFSQNAISQGRLLLRLYYRDGTFSTYYISQNTWKASFTILKEAVAFRIMCDSLSSGINIDYTVYVQLENGKTNTDWIKPEIQQRIFPVQQEMLEGDTFVRQDGKWYEKHNYRKIMLDGINYGCGYIFPNGNFKLKNISKDKQVSDAKKIKDWAVTEDDAVFCTHLKSTNVYAIQKLNSSGITNTTDCGLLLKLDDASEETNTWTQETILAKLKELYEAGTPVIIYYKLAEPILLECTEAQNKVLDEIYNKSHTYKNITNISAESAEVNPIINVKYLKDTEIEHNKLQAQIDEIKELLSTTETSSLLLDNIQKDLESEV